MPSIKISEEMGIKSQDDRKKIEEAKKEKIDPKILKKMAKGFEEFIAFRMELSAPDKPLDLPIFKKILKVLKSDGDLIKLKK